MKEFNLNDYILVNITEYGWKELDKYGAVLGLPHFSNTHIKCNEQIVDGIKYYKMQAHFFISVFGQFVWMSHPAPVNPKILIP